MTVIGFLFRHDHGVFVALAMDGADAVDERAAWAERVRHWSIYGLLVVALMAPYLLFIQWNGGAGLVFPSGVGVGGARDRDRAPVVWPGLFDNPDGVSEHAEAGSLVAAVRDNGVAWMYYIEILLPFFALFVLAASRDGFRPEWPHARAKLAMVAVLGAVLDAGFLRSPLEARLADPSVPLVILVAWLLVAVPRILRSDASLQPRRCALSSGRCGCGAAAGAVDRGAVDRARERRFLQRLDKAAMTERFGKAFERVEHIVGTAARSTGTSASWASRPDRPDLITLSLYVNACTAPTDRVLVQAYMPQVLALARRAFAGGHADLRPGFFETEDAQRLTLERLQRQSVPLILLETDESLRTSTDRFRS